MLFYPDSGFKSSPMLLSVLAAAFVSVVGALTLGCWYAGIVVMPRFAPYLSMFMPNTAAGLIMAGLALLLQIATLHAKRLFVRRSAELLAQSLALLLITLGAVTLAQDFFGLDLHLDQLLVSAPSDGRAYHAGRMAPLTALCLVMAGTGLLLLDHVSRDGHHLAEYCTVVMAGLMGIPMIGYLYSVTLMTQLPAISSIPLHVPIVFFVLAIGMLAARPSHKLVRLWTGNAPGGHLVRSLLPLSLVLLILLNLLVDYGERYGFYGADRSSPIFVLLSSGVLFVLFCRAAVLLNVEYDVRRRGEAALSESNALLTAVSDNTPDGIFVKDCDGRMVFANPAMLRLLGKERSAVLGKSSHDIFDDPDYAASVAQDDHSVLADGVARVFESTQVLEAGTRTLYTTKAPWVDAYGGVRGMVGISTDITKRKRTEDALKAHETHLEALVVARTAEVTELIGHLEVTREEEKRAIARELHDDLGSSLTALSMHLAILFQKMPAEPALTVRAAQIKVLIASIADSTRRIQNGLRPDKLDIFGIKVAITDQALEFEKYTGVACRVSLPDEPLAYDANLNIALFRMVQEALNNIAKYAKASKVVIVLDDNEDEVRLTLRDDGIGIPAGRITNTTTHGLRGMRERAAYLGGSVHIVSGAGAGTTITVFFPKAPVKEGPGTSGDDIK